LAREVAQEIEKTLNEPAPQKSVHLSPSDATAQGGLICEAIDSASELNDLPLEFLTRLIWQESRFNPKAVSPKGARGVAQFMPKTAASVQLDDPFEPVSAIAKSAELLRDLKSQFGNLGLARRRTMLARRGL
jgi:soluble lytic murein transglycosylase-like protein